MALRVTAVQVRELVGDLDEDLVPNPIPFITAANALVTELLADKFDDERLELIELWLSAHFCCITDMRRSSEKVGSVVQQFQYKVDLNLSQTVYGQQAMMFDTSGTLGQYNKAIIDGKKPKPVMSLTWLGTDPLEDTE